jgi:hypothetical protein
MTANVDAQLAVLHEQLSDEGLETLHEVLAHLRGDDVAKPEDTADGAEVATDD